MTIVRWEPLRELSSLQSEMNRLFNTAFDAPSGTSGAAMRRWVPPMDLVESGEQFVLRADLPGMSEEDIQIELEDGTLTVSGERKAEHVLLSRSGMTRLIDRLEREGMVSRSTCDKDGRGCYAGLTERGRATVTEARTTHIAVVRAGFLRHFSEDEMRELATMFERVLDCPTS